MLNDLIETWKTGRFAPFWLIWLLLLSGTSIVAFLMYIGSLRSTEVAHNVACHVVSVKTHEKNEIYLTVDCGKGKEDYSRAADILDVVKANAATVYCTTYADDSVDNCKVKPQ